MYPTGEREYTNYITCTQKRNKVEFFNEIKDKKCKQEVIADQINPDKKVNNLCTSCRPVLSRKPLVSTTNHRRHIYTACVNMSPVVCVTVDQQHEQLTHEGTNE